MADRDWKVEVAQVLAATRQHLAQRSGGGSLSSRSSAPDAQRGVKTPRAPSGPSPSPRLRLDEALAAVQEHARVSGSALRSASRPAPPRASAPPAALIYTPRRTVDAAPVPTPRESGGSSARRTERSSSGQLAPPACSSSQEGGLEARLRVSETRADVEACARREVEARVARLESELSTALDAAVATAALEGAADAPAPAPPYEEAASLQARLAAAEAARVSEGEARREVEARLTSLEGELAAALQAAVDAAAAEASARRAAAPPPQDVASLVEAAVRSLRAEFQHALQAAHTAHAAVGHRVTRLESELATALDAAVAAAAQEASSSAQAAPPATPLDMHSLAAEVQALEARVAHAHAAVRRCEQEAVRASSAAVEAIAGVAAVQTLIHPPSPPPAVAAASAEELSHLRLRVQALETANAADAADSGGGPPALRLLGRVEDVEAALEGVRDALSVMAMRAAASPASTAERNALSQLTQRLRSLEGRVEAAEQAVASASEAAARAEAAAAGAAATSLAARRAADEAPSVATSAALSAVVGTPRDTQGGASALRLARCEQALAQVSSDADAVRSEAVNTRTGVDALALVVEQFVARIESLEADVATVASQQLAAG